MNQENLVISEVIQPEPTDVIGFEWRYRFLIALGFERNEAAQLAKMFAGIKEVL